MRERTARTLSCWRGVICCSRNANAGIDCTENRNAFLARPPGSSVRPIFPRSTLEVIMAASCRRPRGSSVRPMLPVDKMGRKYAKSRTERENWKSKNQPFLCIFFWGPIRGSIFSRFQVPGSNVRRHILRGRSQRLAHTHSTALRPGCGVRRAPMPPSESVNKSKTGKAYYDSVADAAVAYLCRLCGLAVSRKLRHLLAAAASGKRGSGDSAPCARVGLTNEARRRAPALAFVGAGRGDATSLESSARTHERWVSSQRREPDNVTTTGPVHISEYFFSIFLFILMYQKNTFSLPTNQTRQWPRRVVRPTRRPAPARCCTWTGHRRRCADKLTVVDWE